MTMLDCDHERVTKSYTQDGSPRWSCYMCETRFVPQNERVKIYGTNWKKAAIPLKET